MKKLYVMTIICSVVSLTWMVHGFEGENTTLMNKDAKSYAYIIKTACGRDISHDEQHESNRVIHDCGIYYGEIDSRSQAAVCNFGCELTLAATGQTITVEPGDTIVIRKGVLKVR